MNHRIRTVCTAAALIAPLAAVAFAAPASAGSHDPTTIYTETNAASGNAVLAFQETPGGLTSLGTYPTGGLGSGAGLGSQGAVAVAGHRLLAVDAGSDQISLFRIDGHGALTLTDTEPSGGSHPVSVTVDDDTVYVLNGGDSTVNGFRIKGGSLVAIKGSHQHLTGSGAAQIAFDRGGHRLVVTEKATNTIDVLPVHDGVAGPAVSNPSTGQTPFGFAIDRRDHVVVSNAAGGAAGASSLSSYGLSGAASLGAISAPVPTTQTAACWVALSDDGRFAFTTNAGSGSVSSYRIARDGSLTLAQAVASTPGAGPSDMAVGNGELFTLAGGAHVISVARIGSAGTLTPVGQVSVPAGVAGLAAS